jgi:hypothetical protein
MIGSKRWVYWLFYTIQEALVYPDGGELRHQRQSTNIWTADVSSQTTVMRLDCRRLIDRTFLFVLLPAMSDLSRVVEGCLRFSHVAATSKEWRGAGPGEMVNEKYCSCRPRLVELVFQCHTNSNLVA